MEGLLLQTPPVPSTGTSKKTVRSGVPATWPVWWPLVVVPVCQCAIWNNRHLQLARAGKPETCELTNWTSSQRPSEASSRAAHDHCDTNRTAAERPSLANLSSLLGTTVVLKQRAEQESIHIWSARQQEPATEHRGCSQATSGSYLEAVWP